MTADQTRRVVSWLGVTAIVLASAASLAGSPYSGAKGAIDVDQLARAVTREDDHVTAVELAGWIRQQRPELRVIDVRSQREFEEYRIPTAERIPLDSLARARFDRGETIVLYSEGGAHAAQGWVFLRALGYEKVYFLRGGLNEWLEDVTSPAVSIKLTRADSTVSELSKYFGGTPRAGDQQRETAARLKRRGC
jgi:rhodanese-related sulfurtransferase